MIITYNYDFYLQLLNMENQKLKLKMLLITLSLKDQNLDWSNYIMYIYYIS